MTWATFVSDPTSETKEDRELRATIETAQFSIWLAGAGAVPIAHDGKEPW
jgi:hypothetical protein